MTELKKYIWKRPIYIELTTFIVVALFLANTAYILLSHKSSGNENIAFTMVAVVIAILIVLFDLNSIKKNGKTTLTVYDDRITIQIWNKKETVILKSDFKDINIPRYNEGLKINLKDGTYHHLSLRGLKRNLITDIVTTLVTFNMD